MYVWNGKSIFTIANCRAAAASNEINMAANNCILHSFAYIMFQQLNRRWKIQLLLWMSGRINRKETQSVVLCVCSCMLYNASRYTYSTAREPKRWKVMERQRTKALRNTTQRAISSSAAAAAAATAFATKKNEVNRFYLKYCCCCCICWKCTTLLTLHRFQLWCFALFSCHSYIFSLSLSSFFNIYI